MRIVVETNFSLEHRRLSRRANRLLPHAGFQLIHLIASGATLLINPYQSIELDLNQQQVLVVRLAPELLIETATRLRLGRAGFELRFRQPPALIKPAPIKPAPIKPAPIKPASIKPASVKDDVRLRGLLDSMLVEMEGGQAGWREVITASINQLTVHLLRAHINVERSDEVELSRVGLVDRRLRRAIEFMHDNCARELKLAEIARAAYLSEFHFARLFKKITGTTPHAYLAALRLERARRLLAETDLAISEVGAEVGYPSQSHFTKVFREAAGLTPKAFRDAARHL